MEMQKPTNAPERITYHIVPICDLHVAVLADQNVVKIMRNFFIVKIICTFSLQNANNILEQQQLIAASSLSTMQHILLYNVTSTNGDIEIIIFWSCS